MRKVYLLVESENIYQVNQKKIPPTTFVDITAMHGNFCTVHLVSVSVSLYGSFMN